MKQSFSPIQLHVLCNRCSKILASDFNFALQTPNWEIVMKTKKGLEPRQQRFDFCDEKCRITYFRGRKYWNRKLKHQRDNWEWENRETGKN